MGELAQAQGDPTTAKARLGAAYQQKMHLAALDRSSQDWQLKTFWGIWMLLRLAEEENDFQGRLNWSEKGILLCNAQPGEFRLSAAWRNRYLYFLLAHVEAALSTRLPEGKTHALAIWKEILQVRDELIASRSLDDPNGKRIQEVSKVGAFPDQPLQGAK